MKLLLKLALLSVILFDLINIWFDLPYRFISKSLFIPILLLYYIISVEKRNMLFVIALIFAWLGDVFLLGEGSLYFALGLSSFMVMQILYTLIFLRDRQKPHSLFYPTLIFLILYCLAFNIYLAPNTGSLQIPVIIYSIAIAAMAFAAAIRHPESIAYKMILFGVILFVISDSILSINKFAGNFWKGGFFVMLTYMLAQYFIVEGYLRFSNSTIYKE